MPYTDADCQRAREHFPALGATVNGHAVAYLDGPGGTQTPETVIEAVAECYRSRNANFDGMFETSVAVTESVWAVRQAVADFLGAEEAASISFGANMTSLNFALSHALGRGLQRGDEVIITALDHEANRGPWQGLTERDVVVREVRMDEAGEIDMADFEEKINERTRIIAVTLASNALGTVPDFETIRNVARNTSAYVVVDAVHYAAHFPVDVRMLDCDFLLCSAYKFYGPHVGILYARPGLLDTLETDRLRTQKGEAPYRIETGTLNHVAIAGVGAAVDYLASWGKGADRRERLLDAMQGIAAYEHELAHYYYDSLDTIAGVARWGPDFNVARRAPTVSVSLAGTTPKAAAGVLAQAGLQLWHGHFYALRVMESLGVANEGMLRTGISMYNTRGEIDRLLHGLDAIQNSDG
jgi:cysteine desulfurase family protein (TIGR01976 family)